MAILTKSAPHRASSLAWGPVYTTSSSSSLRPGNSARTTPRSLASSTATRQGAAAIAGGLEARAWITLVEGGREGRGRGR